MGRKTAYCWMVSVCCHGQDDVAVIQQHEDLYLRLLRPGNRIPCSIAYRFVDSNQIMLIWISQGAAQDCLDLRHDMLVVGIIACPLELMMLRKSHTETFFLSYVLPNRDHGNDFRTDVMHRHRAGISPVKAARRCSDWQEFLRRHDMLAVMGGHRIAFPVF